MPKLGNRRDRPHGGRGAWKEHHRPSDVPHGDIPVPGHVAGLNVGAGPERVTRIEAMR
jgi:hypothetical protein